MAKLPLSLRAYMALTHLVPLLAKRHLKKRVARGKEHPTRWTEKLGQATITRPRGPLIWLHAVGLGEVLSLRGLIHEMADQTDANFLVTSGTLAGANAFAKNAPPRTIHQFLPLDAPQYRQAFLDHWQPDLCVWVEQDIWPGFVADLARRDIPQTLIAARMNAKSHARHARTTPLFSFIYKQMRLITAQDANTQTHLQNLGASNVIITGSLKSSAPPLQYDAAELSELQTILGPRFTWTTAPAHQADVDLALAAHAQLLTTKPDALLIIAPRFPDRENTISVPHTVRSKGEKPTENVWLADTFGDLGLIYSLADAALIGGTNDNTEGHNPWEAVALNTAIFHGPRVANFQTDYDALDKNGALCITSPAELTDALIRDLQPNIAAASDLRAKHGKAITALAKTLTDVIRQHD
ncbi:3-deoxy-D-manno-octulosonic-acid transferase [Loktanella ponticola]|uniref:3-deoxy-D-manno-octulosonic acid transferase n=1 Tax=Yoonia ponticola TaxID=1524255 RepID=A0A7W9BLI7_9RHOB|nr:3-deoxy-D-manno-octulosonic-acid transferase [Yoonia ponticola]